MIPWSWFFILLSLLVRRGNAIVPQEDRIFHRRDAQDETDSSFVGLTPMSQGSAVAIVICFVAGVVITFGVLGWCYVARRPRNPIPDEESMPGTPEEWKGWKATELKSKFSPDGKNPKFASRNFERIRRVFSLHRKKKKEGSSPMLPTHREPFLGTIGINRPLPALSTPMQHHPGVLEREHRKVLRRVPPPPLEPHPELSEPSDTSSCMLSSSSLDEGMGPPESTLAGFKPVTVLPPIQPLSCAKTAVLRSRQLGPPPSRRKSLLSKPLKHPFLPLRSPDISLKYPPGSPFSRYQPARHHLQARLGNRALRTDGSGMPSESPRIKVLALRENGSATKHERLVGALHSASAGGRGTPTGYRGALPSPARSAGAVAAGSQHVPVTAYV